MKLEPKLLDWNVNELKRELELEDMKRTRIWVIALPYFTQMMIFSPNTSFWMRKGVIWRLFHDDLRAREWEREEKGTRNSALKKI